MKRYLKTIAALLALMLTFTCALAEGLEPIDEQTDDPAVMVTGEEALEEDDATLDETDGETICQAVDAPADEQEIEYDLPAMEAMEASAEQDETNADEAPDEPDATSMDEAPAEPEEAVAEDVASAADALAAVESVQEPDLSQIVETLPETTVVEGESDEAFKAPLEEAATAPTEAVETVTTQTLAGGKAKRVPVLVYHKVLTDAEKKASNQVRNRYSVSVSTFTKQMNWLKEKGYTAITCEELYQWRTKQIDLPKRSILITLDDGFASTVENIIPILEATGMKATVFVIGSASYSSNGTKYITLNRIHEVQKDHPCIEFQSHTWDLHNINAYRTEEYDAFALDALRQREVYGFTYIAYPYGKNSKTMIKAYKKNGIKMAFLFGSSKDGYATRKQNLYKMKRIEITGTMSFKKFKKWCN